MSKDFFYLDLRYYTARRISVSEIVEGVRRGGGSPLRPVIDEGSVEEEVNNDNGRFSYNLMLYLRVYIVNAFISFYPVISPQHSILKSQYLLKGFTCSMIDASLRIA